MTVLVNNFKKGNIFSLKYAILREKISFGGNMKEQFTRERIGEEVYFSSVNIDKFTTSRISVNFILDLDRETVTANSLVAFLLRKGCGMYPDFTALNLRLDELYGATISTDVKKFGDKQIINVTGACINDRFALDDENMISELAELICNIITDPVMQNGRFLQKEIDVEKNILCDTIRSVRDDKGAYVIEKLISEMCADEPFGLKKYGYCEDMDKLTADYVTDCYKKILSTAKIEILCSGEKINQNLKTVFVNAFSKIERRVQDQKKTTTTPPAETPRKIEEKLNVSQSKVALGFSSGIPLDDKRSLALRLMSAVYGGDTSSKLFTVVREEMSLCYYCASMVERTKGIMIAYSGVQEKNRKKTIEAMLAQLDEVRNGNFTDEDIKQAKASIITGLESVSDSLYGIEAWYLGQILSGIKTTPEEEISLINKLTAEDVCEAAKAMKLNVVYSIVEGGDRE